MKAINVQFVRQDEINDIFSYTDENNEVQYTKFPRTMEMSCKEVEDFLND